MGMITSIQRLTLRGLSILTGTIFFVLRLSRPRRHGEMRLHAGSAEVLITMDTFGVPTIKASSRTDAYWALGYLIARDRLFQIDLLRRMVSGRLAEIFGAFAIPTDTRQRTLGFQQVATAVLQRLPQDQLQVLQSYTNGINDYRKDHPRRPLECLLLRYTPEVWTPRDCILIGLYIFQDLTSNAETYKRSASIMRQTLPTDVLNFFTADEDAYPHILLGGQQGHRPLSQIPVESLKHILIRQIATPVIPFNDDLQQVKGSNGWVVGPAHTRDGRAILANDMHLSLSVPGIWYKATLQYDRTTLVGMVVPGLPGVMLGSNGHVAWGFTNSCGDFLDLIELELHPELPDTYKTPDGWRPFTTTKEQITVRKKQPVEVTIRSTIWGPVSHQPLLGKPIALHWTALDPDAMSCHILDMDRVKTLAEAITVMHQFGAPPMNAMLVDAAGHIGWTICGKIPIRSGGDGFASTSWADGTYGWSGYIAPDEMPCIIDPPEGFLVTANNRTVGSEYPYVIGHNYASGYRARRIHNQLKDLHNVTEETMFALQLDSTCDFYRFYYQLVDELLTPDILAQRPHLREIKAELEAWDGRAEIDSRGIALLTRFREKLAERILEAYFTPCIQADEKFTYGWNSMELPLRKLLTERKACILPHADIYPDWDLLIIMTLEECAKKMQQDNHVTTHKNLTWGLVHQTRIGHPLGFAIKLLGPLLNMPSRPLAGSAFSIRASTPGYGATVRMVVSPSHEHDGLYNIPSGQSGHPFSRHYRDQYPYWLHGKPLPLSNQQET